MPNELVFLLRLVASGVFVVALYAGYYMFKNYERLFGVDPNMPSEGQSSRAYSQVQVFAIWSHILLASGAFALLLH
ncbi:MAG TPA: hypothetical protein VGO90_08905 [Chthoniobacteraceae bacterium]|jgi:hypothetical protein|nr:hypothetical protein [Chthoniobacter sp.]HEV7867786.1 hypothetical protein [Chthoniobacteraceae bacterium]